MSIIPNPVKMPDESMFSSDLKNGNILLTVGRLDYQKDHAVLLHAFAGIRPRFPGWKLRIIGDGTLRPALEDLIRRLSLEKEVSMPGVTSNIDAEYQNADVFVLPSRYESFGLVTAEAMSYGLPAIGFADCPGTNELIRHNETGILSSGKPDRITSLARDMEMVMSDPALRRRLGQDGKAAIKKHYSVEHIITLWEELLRDVCA
jgi:glycosyltransferase involved in cell wall biosynthesis